MVELCGRCGCGLQNHLKKPCDNTYPDGSRCPCPSGIRTDAFLCQQMAMFGRWLIEAKDELAKIRILLQIASGQEVVITRKPDGTEEILIKPFGPSTTGGLIVPSH